MGLWSAAERPGLLLAAVYLAAAVHGLGAADIVGDDEAREAGIVQDVVAGHWLWPRFNDELLPDKPILYHWLAAVPCALAGFSETAVRLPSAVAGATLVGWTAWFGTRLLGTPAGLVAAAMVATTPALFTHARVARPDLLLVFLLCAALGRTFRWWRAGARRDATAALVLLGAATFAKGPVAPVLAGLTLIAFLAWEGELGRLGDFVTWPGLMAFVVLGLGWYAVALAGWGDLFVREHLVGRYLHNLAGGLVVGGTYSKRSLAYHLGFYLVHLPAVALPWTPFVALALWRAWRTGGFRDPRLRFLLCWAAAPVIAFTPAQYKLRYYLLPSLPALALLAAPTVVELCHRPARLLGRRGMLVLAAGAAVALAGAVWVVTTAPGVRARSDRDLLAAILPLVPGGVAGAVAGVGFLAGILLVAIALRAWPAVVGLVIAGTLAWMIVGAPAVEQAISRRESFKSFAVAVRTRFPAPASVAFFRQTIRSVAVYMSRPVPTLHGRRALKPGLAVIATESAYQTLAGEGRVGPPLVTGKGRTGNLTSGRAVLAVAGGS